MTAVTDQINRDRKFEIAMGDPLLHIKQIIPYLEQRHYTAKKSFNYARTPEEKETYMQMIEQINEELKKIIGL